MNLSHAIAQLDPKNAEHWTADGLPRMDAVADLCGDVAVSRKDVTDAAPGLTREVAAAQATIAREQPEAPADLAYVAPAVEAPVAELVPEPDAPIDLAGVLDLPIDEVFGHPELTSAALEALNEKVKAALKAKGVIENELKQLYAKSEVLGRVQIQHERIARRNGTKKTNIQEYLAAQSRTREERAARARKFIDGGTTAKDVLEQLRGSSKIDAAMSQRRAAPGSKRPAVRVPAGL